MAVGNDVVAPAGAVSALCDFAVEAVGSDPVLDVFLDGLSFRADPHIFSNGFESGDTSAWTLTVP